jgi:hypothetical protein
MDRKGQTWNMRRVVFSVLRSFKPTSSRPWWLHEVVYLENPSAQRYEGTKQELEESLERSFEKYPEMRRIS